MVWTRHGLDSPAGVLAGFVLGSAWLSLANHWRIEDAVGAWSAGGDLVGGLLGVVIEGCWLFKCTPLKNKKRRSRYIRSD